MFVLKSLGKLILGGSNAADLLVLEDGWLWKLESGVTRKGLVLSRSLMYGLKFYPVFI